MGDRAEQAHDGSLDRWWACWMVGLEPLYMRAEAAEVAIFGSMALPSTEMRRLRGKEEQQREARQMAFELRAALALSMAVADGGADWKARQDLSPFYSRAR